MADPLSSIDDIANLRSIPVAIKANPGSIALENIANVLNEVDDQGTATPIGTGAGGITALTGDVTASGSGSVAATIGANKVTNAKAAQMAANTIKGNNTGSTANAADLTVAQVQALIGGTPLSWAQGRQARAIALLNPGGTQVSNPIAIDFMHTPGTAGSTNPPTLSTAYSGGVYSFPGPGFGSLIPFGAALATSATLVALPKTESWYLAGLFRFEAAAAGSGKTSVPLRLINAGATTFIEIELSQAVSATVFQLLFTDGTPVTTPLTSVGTLGSGTCPVAAWFTIEMYYDAGAGTLNVGFSDTLAVSLSGAGLNHMPTDAQVLEVLGSDDTSLMKCGGLFAMLKGLS